MVVDVVQLLPPWLLTGLLAGSAASVLVAGIFYLGERYLRTDPGTAGRRVRGSARRHAEIRDYFRTIGEPFSEAHVLDGTEVAFYLPDHEVAVTFDARNYFRLQKSGVFTVLCEEEMPGHRIGIRLPFETPAFEPPPTGNARVDAAFRELGLPRSADGEAVQSTYRERVKRAHPDQGGDETTFRRLQEAYVTASNYCERRSDRRAPDRPV